MGYKKHHNEFWGTNKKHRTSWLVEWVLILRENPAPWNQYIILVDAIKIPEPVHLVIACEAMNLSKFLLQSLLGQLKALSRSSVVKLWIVTHHNQLSVKTKNHFVNTHSKKYHKYESEEPRTDLHTCVKLRNPWEIHSLNALLKSWTSEVSLRIKSYIFIYKEILLNFHFMYSNTPTPKMHFWNQEHHTSA